MNDISVVGEVQVLTAEILMLKQQTAQNIIEIGKRLVLVKESLGHGEWLPWLEQKVEFSDQQARRLMKVAKECSNSTALLNLPPTKVFALLDLPADQREEFVNTPHVVSGEAKTVQEMTTRQLQQLIKDKDELQKKLDNADKNTLQLETERNKLLKDKVNLESSLEIERKKAKSDKEQLEALLKEAKDTGSSAEIVTDLESRLKIAESEVQRLTEAMNEPVTLEPAIIETEVEKIPEEIERELAELRQKAQEFEAKKGKLDPAQSAILRYSIHFEELVNGFKLLLADLSDIQNVDAANYERYRRATADLIGKMNDRL